MPVRLECASACGTSRELGVRVDVVDFWLRLDNRQNRTLQGTWESMPTCDDALQIRVIQRRTKTCLRPKMRPNGSVGIAATRYLSIANFRIPLGLENRRVARHREFESPPLRLSS